MDLRSWIQPSLRKRMKRSRLTGFLIDSPKSVGNTSLKASRTPIWITQIKLTTMAIWLVINRPWEIHLLSSVIINSKTQKMRKRKLNKTQPLIVDTLRISLHLIIERSLITWWIWEKLSIQIHCWLLQLKVTRALLNRIVQLMTICRMDLLQEFLKCNLLKRNLQD